MATVARNYQNQLIEDAVKNNKSINVFLHNGKKVNGDIISHDFYTLFLKSETEQMLIYKHSITSIFPASFLYNKTASGNEPEQKEQS